MVSTFKSNFKSKLFFLATAILPGLDTNFFKTSNDVMELNRPAKVNKMHV